MEQDDEWPSGKRSMTLRVVPSSTFQHPFRNKTSPPPPLARSLVVLLRSIPYSQRELPLRVVRFHVRSSTRFYVLYCSTIPQRELSSASKSAPAPGSAMRGPCLHYLPARSLSYALSIVGLYSRCEL